MKRDLECYEEDNILLPALTASHEHIKNNTRLKCLYGEELERSPTKDGTADHIVRYLLPCDDTYYYFGGLSTHNNDWLTKFHETGFVEFLRQPHGAGWYYYNREKDVKPESMFNDRERAIRHERFYAKHQIFPVKYLQMNVRLKLHYRDMFRGDDWWRETGRSMRKQSTDILSIHETTVRYYYDTFALLNNVQDVINEMFVAAKEVYDSSSGTGATESEAMKDAQSCIEHLERHSIPGRAEALLRTCGMTVEDVAKRRHSFLGQGMGLDPITAWFPYVEFVPQPLIGRCSNNYRLALDSYGIAHQLGWYLKMLGREPETVAKTVTAFKDHYSKCIYCGDFFIRENRRQKTCGKPPCVQANKNSSKRLRRLDGAMS